MTFARAIWSGRSEKPVSFFQRGGADTMPPVAEGGAARDLHALLNDWRVKHDLRPSDMVRPIGKAGVLFSTRRSRHDASGCRGWRSARSPRSPERLAREA